ncbi:discoidin domain-containing protein [Acidobacteriota bacterium]
MKKDIKIKVCVLILFSVIALFQLYPLSFNLNDSVHDPGDPMLTTWIIGWMQNQILHDPLHLFEGNAFFPYHNTLTFSEHLFTQALFSLPLHFIIKNPLLIHNIIFLLTYILGAYFTFLLINYLTKNYYAGVIGGMIFAFSAFHMSQTPHIQVLSSGAIPLTFLYLHKYFQNERLKHSVLFSLFFTLQALACIYYGLFSISILAVILPILLIFNWRKLRWGFLAKFGVPLLFSGGILLVFYLPYIELFKKSGLRRYITLGADVGNYLAPMAQSVFFKGLTALGRNERNLSPGFIAIALMLFCLLYKIYTLKTFPTVMRKAGIVLFNLFLFFGIVCALKDSFFIHFLFIRVTSYQLFLVSFLALMAFFITWLYFFLVQANKLEEEARDENRYFFLYMILGVWAFLLSFGNTFSYFGRYAVTLPLPFTWFYNYVPGFKGIRVPPRYAVYVILGIAVLAGYGLKYLFQKFNKPRIQFIVAIALLVFLNLEFLVIPHRMVTLPVGKEVPPTYEWIRDNAGDNPILELPFFSSPGRNSIYMFYSLFHKKKIVNGYSGYIPPSTLYFNGLVKTFPSDLCLDVFRLLKVKYVILHTAMWDEELTANKIRSIEDNFPDDLKIVKRFDYSFQKENFLSTRFGRDIIVEVNLDKKEENPAARAAYQLIPNHEWTVTANAKPQLLRYLKDGQVHTRWSTQRPRTRGDWLQFEFSEPKKVSKIALHLGNFHTEFGINFIVEISRDGINWERKQRYYYPSELIDDLVNFRKDPVQNLYFDPEEVKFIKITQTHNTRNWWWSYTNVKIYE